MLKIRPLGGIQTMYHKCTIELLSRINYNRRDEQKAKFILLRKVDWRVAKPFWPGDKAPHGGA
jgi:hypothetical protein